MQACDLVPTTASRRALLLLSQRLLLFHPQSSLQPQRLCQLDTPRTRGQMEATQCFGVELHFVLPERSSSCSCKVSVASIGRNAVLYCAARALQLPFSLGYLQQQCAPPAPVDWEAAAKQYCAYRAPQSQPQSQSEQQQQQRPEDYGGKRKRATKGFKEMPHETAETDDVTPPGVFTCAPYTPLLC